MYSVEIKNLDLHFGDTHVLDNLNLGVSKGEFLVLLGSSGCGKSTLLNCIAGLLDVNRGQIFINDINVTWAEPSERGIGMVFQSYALYPQMSVEGNLSFGLKNAGVAKAEIDKRIARAAEVLQIESLLKRKPAALSGGQRQRVAIGRALVRDVDVFLFDEPLSNLDAKLRSDLRVEIKRLHQKLGNTMIYVTHDQVEAMTLADRIAIMKDGKIMQLGAPEDIYSRPHNIYVADFIGSPAMNFLEGNYAEGIFKGGGLDISMEGYEFSNRNASGAAILGLRPEHIVTGELVSGAEIQTEVIVDLVDPMGSDTIVYARLGGQIIRIRMDGRAQVRVDQRLSIGITPSCASLFDAESEMRI